MKSKRFQTRWFWVLMFLFWGTLQILSIHAQDIGQSTAVITPTTQGNAADPLAVGPVVYLSYRIDDDNGGASNGNGNGRAESGERVELMVTVINQGNQTATVVLGELGTSDSDVTMFDTVCDWPDIPGGTDTGGRGTNFGFEVKSDLYQDKSVRFGLTVRASNGDHPWSSSFDVPICASPRLRVTPTSLDFGTTLTQQTFAIENGGGSTCSTLRWNISTSAWWITISPSNGEGDQTVTVTVNRNGLSGGEYEGIINVEANYGSERVTVRMAVVSPPKTTVTTNPIGRQIIVDGTTYTAPQDFFWPPGSQHTIGVTSPQSGTTGTQYVFSSWSDSGVQNHTIIAPSSNTTYTANFTTQYFLTINAGTGGTVSPASNWYNSGQNVTITAIPNSGYVFVGWTGSGSGSYTGPNNPATVTMNGPVTETASFILTPPLYTVTTSPSGLQIVVDGTTYTAPRTFSWSPGSQHTIGVTSPQSGITGSRYVYNSWSDGGGQTHTITAPSSSTTYTSSFTTQYYLTMNAGTGGTVSPASNWYNSGQNVTITATPNSGYVFAGWTGTGSGSYTGPNNPATVTTNGPITETASFNFTPPSGEIKPEIAATTQPIGGEFEINISVNSVQNLFGVSFELTYTTTYVDALSSASGSFLGNDVVFFPTIEDPDGKVGIGISRKSGQSGVSGTGVVAQIKFKSLLSTPPGTQVTFALRNVTANDPTGGSIQLNASTTVTITLINPGIIVWPGDSNNDKIVNQADVLPVGLHWGRTGPRRANASSSWTGQAATPWSPEAATYADVNGDGTVNQADVLPIGLNWGGTHTSPSLVIVGENNVATLHKTNAVTIGTTTTGDTNPGQDFWVEVRVDQVVNLFGISFELLYTPTTLADPQATEAGSFLGNDVVFLANPEKNLGKVSVGISRKSGQGGINGSGVIVRVKMHVSNQAVRGQVITLTLQNVAANDPNGQPIQLGVAPPQLVVVSVASKPASSLPRSFALHANTPNPFSASGSFGKPATTIHYDLPQASDVTVEIIDMLGKQVRTLVKERQPAGRHVVTWDGRDEHGKTMSSGMFIYQLRVVDPVNGGTGNFVQSRKMLFLR